MPPRSRADCSLGSQEAAGRKEQRRHEQKLFTLCNAPFLVLLSTWEVEVRGSEVQDLPQIRKDRRLACATWDSVSKNNKKTEEEKKNSEKQNKTLVLGVEI